METASRPPKRGEIYLWSNRVLMDLERQNGSRRKIALINGEVYESAAQRREAMRGRNHQGLAGPIREFHARLVDLVVNFENLDGQDVDLALTDLREKISVFLNIRHLILKEDAPHIEVM